MIVYSSLRKIAKSDYYQSIFSSLDKGFRIFDNDNDLTHIQVYFLSYLNFYYNLNSKIYAGELNKRVLENIIYEDAYSFCESIKNKEKKRYKAPKEPEPKSNPRKEKRIISSSSWVFKSKK